MDLNADMAEGNGPEGWAADAALLDVVTSANIACGGHAGDPETMRRACEAALGRGVRIGAHPGYADRENFGRIELALPVGEIASQVEEQLALLRQIAAEEGGSVTHVKPHGALYHLAAGDAEVADAVVQGAQAAGGGLAVVGPPDSALLAAATRAGLRPLAEGFPDRAYRPDGHLVPRGEPGAVVCDAPTVAARAVTMVRDGCVEAQDGSRWSLRVDTLCLHGDSPGAARSARAVREALDAAGIVVVAP